VGLRRLAGIKLSGDAGHTQLNRDLFDE
jgi:hypothetical protein